MEKARLPLNQDRRWRILGVSFVMYVLSFVDRTNIAMAIPAMRAELRLSAVANGEAKSGHRQLGVPVAGEPKVQFANNLCGGVCWPEIDAPVDASQATPEPKQCEVPRPFASTVGFLH